MSESDGNRSILIRRAVDALRRDGVGSIEIRQVAAGVEVALPVITALESLADLHHRTLTNSRLHDPERVDSFRDCPCLSCRAAAAALAAALSESSDQEASK